MNKWIIDFSFSLVYIEHTDQLGCKLASCEPYENKINDLLTAKDTFRYIYSNIYSSAA